MICSADIFMTLILHRSFVLGEQDAELWGIISFRIVVDLRAADYKKRLLEQEVMNYWNMTLNDEFGEYWYIRMRVIFPLHRDGFRTMSQHFAHLSLLRVLELFRANIWIKLPSRWGSTTSTLCSSSEDLRYETWLFFFMHIWKFLS